MTKEEAFTKLDQWSPRERKTYETILAAYRRLRDRLGPTAYIKRADLAAEYGSNSIGTASKYMPIIEALENDQPHHEAANGGPQSPFSEPHSIAVQNAFNTAHGALETLSRAITDSRAAENAELSQRYQTILQDQQVAAEARQNADQARIADLEAAASGAGEESCENYSIADELRAALVEAEAERDAAMAQAEHIYNAREIDRAKMTSAEAQTALLQKAEAILSDEVLRLKTQCDQLAAEAASAADLRVNAEMLRERASSLESTIRRLEALIVENDRRHERDRDLLRSACEHELSEERQRARDREAQLLALIATAVVTDGASSQ